MQQNWSTESKHRKASSRRRLSACPCHGIEAETAQVQFSQDQPCFVALLVRLEQIFSAIGTSGSAAREGSHARTEASRGPRPSKSRRFHFSLSPSLSLWWSCHSVINSYIFILSKRRLET